MHVHRTGKHTVDFLFSILLFLLFAASALLLVLIGAKVYQAAAGRMEENYTVRTALAYVTEKVRQSDEAGAVFLSHIEGNPALVLNQEIDGTAYSTYIYGDDHCLKELFIRSSSAVTLDMGHSIVELLDFSIEEAGEHSFRLTATNQKGESSSILISPQSRKEDAS